jgi:type II secretion system protein I
MRLCPPRRDGLSLIEVLAALAIFLMALVALVHLINTASNFAFEAHHRSNAARICQSKMASLVAGAIPLQAQSEAADEDEPEYRWSATVDSAGPSNLSTVTVRVSFGSDKDYPITATLTRMVLDPTVAGSTQDVPASSSSSSNTAGSGSSGTTGN